MKLYIDATGKYVARQDEAKRAGKGWHQVEVPTTEGRDTLADYLNGLRWSERQIDGIERAQMESAFPPAPPAAPVAPINASVATVRTADDIVAFILDEAPVHQVENILAAIGTRFGELAKAAR